MRTNFSFLLITTLLLPTGACGNNDEGTAGTSTGSTTDAATGTSTGNQTTTTDPTTGGVGTSTGGGSQTGTGDTGTTGEPDPTESPTTGQVETTDPTTGGTTTTGDDTTGIDTLDTLGSSTGIEDLCPSEPNETMCQTCINDNCCDEQLACADDQKCGCFLTCLGEGGDFQQCAMECMLGNPMQNMALADLGACRNENCAEQCM
jgi:hypothetical protein